MYVYLIQSGTNSKSPIKIGMSKDPEARIKQLQTGNPKRLRIILIIKCTSTKHARNLESTMHQMLSSKNIINEWFDVTQNRFFTALNRFANDESIDTVVNNTGLFNGATKEEEAEALVRKSIEKDFSLAKRNAAINKKLKTKCTEAKNAINKLIVRKRESVIFREMLIEFGMNQKEINERLGRKC